MVRLAHAVPVLDRKLLRDLWEMKGQSLAIAAVIGAGVAMFVTYLSNFDSLRRTRDAYYERARFADVFASVKRAPASLELSFTVRLLEAKPFDSGVTLLRYQPG